jgi:hypothetical protein
MSSLITAITLDDNTGTAIPLHDGTKRKVRLASGLAGISPVRPNVRPRPTGHGSINHSRFTDGSRIVVEGHVQSPVSEEDCFAEFRDLIAPMLQTLDDEAALLKWREGAQAQYTNLWTNPRAANDLTNVSGSSASAVVTREADIAAAAGGNAPPIDAETGFKGAITVSGGRIEHSFDVANGVARTLSVYVYIESITATSLRLFSRNAAGAVVQTGAATATTGAWTRLQMTFTPNAAETWTFGLQQNGAGAVTFYFTGVQMELGSTASTYGDGDSDDGVWSGAPHASSSVIHPGKQKLVKLDSDVDPVFEPGMPVLRYQAQFLADDPRAYSQQQTEVTGALLSAETGGDVFPDVFPDVFLPGGGGSASFHNSGNRPTPLVFRIYGRAVDPQIVRLDTDQRIVLSGTVPAGTYLEIDVAARTIKMGGTVNQRGFLDASVSSWSDAPVGTSNWRLTAAEFDGTARLDVLGRSAYA